MEDLYNHINPDTNRHAPLISLDLINLIRKNKEQLNSVVIYDRYEAYSLFLSFSSSLLRGY